MKLAFKIEQYLWVRQFFNYLGNCFCFFSIVSRPGARIAWLGGAEINFEGAREVYLCEFKRGTGAREIYSSLDQTNKKKTPKKRSSVQNFHKFWLSSQNSCDVSRILKWRPKKVFVPKVLWNPVWVHKNYENTGGKHQFGPQIPLQVPRGCCGGPPSSLSREGPQLTSSMIDSLH